MSHLPWHGLPKRLHHTCGQQKQKLRGTQAAAFAFAVRLLIEPGGRAETTDQIEEGDDTKNAALTLAATAEKQPSIRSLSHEIYGCT